MVAKPAPLPKPTAVPPAKAAPPAKPAELQAKPSPLSQRKVKRYIAVCPFIDTDESAECTFNSRPKPTLHKTSESADVECQRHIRETHALELHAERTVVIRYQRTVVDIEVAPPAKPAEQ